MSRAIHVGCLLAFGFSAMISAAPGNDNYESGADSWHWTPQEWTYTGKYANIRNYTYRPNEEALKGLSVEWQKPEMDTLGNVCTIRGQVKTTHGQKQTKPIDWFQGVTVYLGMVPDAKPDWSKGMDQADTLSETALTSPTGTFQAQFDMRKSKQERSKSQSFQFGLALANHAVRNKTDQEVVWNSRTPAIPSSVEMLSVPAAQAMSRELQLINRASGWPFTNPNGVDLIRAVNALQSLGKERALKVLEEYVDLARGRDYNSDQEIVFWIIRVLFEPIQVGDRIPSPAIAVHLDDRDFPEAMKWPLNPMTVHGDVPFMLGHQTNMSGSPEPPWSHLRWAQLHGVIRDNPLAPTEDPLAAANAILQSRRFKALDKYSRDEATKAIRLQALAMVGALIHPTNERKPIDDDQWQSSVKKASEGGVRWDAKREQFVTEPKP
jgi:hypothetical protein